MKVGAKIVAGTPAAGGGHLVSAAAAAVAQGVLESSTNECVDLRRRLAALEAASMAFADAQSSNFRLLAQQSTMLSMILRSQAAYKDTEFPQCAALPEPEWMVNLRARTASEASSALRGAGLGYD